MEENKVKIRVAGIVPMNDGFVLMHRKHVIRNKDYQEYYTFPGGHLEKGETFVNVKSFCSFLAKKYVGFWQRNLEGEIPSFKSLL